MAGCYVTAVTRSIRTRARSCLGRARQSAAAFLATPTILQTSATIDHVLFVLLVSISCSVLDLSDGLPEPLPRSIPMRQISIPYPRPSNRLSFSESWSLRTLNGRAREVSQLRPRCSTPTWRMGRPLCVRSFTPPWGKSCRTSHTTHILTV